MSVANDAPAPLNDALQHLPPDALRPWAGNARTHSKKQLRQIADSIRTFGFTNPVLIDERTPSWPAMAGWRPPSCSGLRRCPAD